MQTAILGAGCFWCIEAIFAQLKGVNSVKSGYSGGSIKNPGYREICTGRTGHAEVIRIEFDNTIISFTEILEIFFKVHDPTTLNRQGNDIGTQYRSAIFFTNEQQKETANYIIQKLAKAGVYSNPIVTEVTPAGEFYPAEKEHDNYFNEHKEEQYCSLVIQPKVAKFQQVFKHLIKK